MLAFDTRLHFEFNAIFDRISKVKHLVSTESISVIPLFLIGISKNMNVLLYSMCPKRTTSKHFVSMQAGTLRAPTEIFEVNFTLKCIDNTKILFLKMSLSPLIKLTY